MNLNDFVVLPKSKAKSVKLNARNLQELQMETVTLAHESKEMEEKLQQLKESMSKEKEERGHSEGFRWKSGQFGSLNSNAQANSNKKNKENRLQKLSAGKVKIRVLKEELTVPPQPPPAAPAIGFRTTRKNRLKGTHCGQCEVKTAGIMCAECTENYCVGCFTKFHQKGALKLHRMIPIQTDLQTHVSTRDVVSCFQNQIKPSSDSTFTNCNPSPRSKPNPDHTFMSNAFTRRVDWSPEKGTEDAAKPMKVHPDSCQVLAVNHGEEIKVGMIEEGMNREDETGSHTFLLRGQFSEEESARSFQEALRQWRGEKSDGEGQPVNQAAMWTPFRPASVSSMATQADLAPDRGDEGREGRAPVRVEFTDNSLTYMDRLLLKKHRRTPVETYHPSLAFGTDFKSPPHTNSEEETANSLTAQEEDFHRYYASLFAVPVMKARTEPQISTPESCLIIEVLDEHHRATDGASVTEGRKDNKRKVPTVEQVLNKGRAPVLQTALTCSESTKVCSPSPSPTQASRPSSRASAQPPKTAQKLHHSEPHTSQAKRRTSKVPSSKSKPSARPTAETPRTSRTSIKTPSSMSQKPNCSPAVHKSKPDRDSPRLLSSPSLPHSQTEISKSYSHSPVSFSPGVSPLASNRGPMPEESLSLSPSVSFSLRSTFTVSPSSSTESTLLPKVCQSTQFHNGSDLSLLLEQLQSSQLSTQPISSVKLSKSPVASNLESQRQSQHSLCESPLTDNHLQLPVSSSPNSPPPPQSLERLPLERSLSGLSLFNESPQDAYSRHRSTARNEDAQVFISSSPISGDHGSTLSHQDTQCIPSHRLNVIRNPPLAPEMEEEEELSIDSGDEMSSDSLGLASHEEDSSDEESQMQRRLTTGTSREEEQDDLQSHAQEQLSNASRVMQRQGAGSGDQDGHPPIGVDIYSAHKHCDSLHTSQTFANNSDPRASDGFGPSSSVSAYAEEHLVFKMMEENHTQPAGIQMHSTTHTGEISANELGASAFRPLSRATQEIMEICNVDQTGCEDPDLDTDTTAHTIQSLEQELRLMARETAKQDPLCPTTGNSGSQDQHGSSYSTWDRVSEEQRDEEAAALRDRQSVLLLP